MKLFNLNVGVKIDNNKQVADLILKDSYDIITIQEAMRKLENGVNPLYDSCNVIKEYTNYQNNFFGALWLAKEHRKNGSKARTFGGYVEQGNQLLTNLPIVNGSNVFYYKQYSTFEDTTNFREDDHPRAFISVILDVNGKQLQIINVHGLWNKDKTGNNRTMHQIDTILSHIREDIPCIVAGDFNLLPETECIKKMSKSLTNLIEKYNIKSTRPSFDDGLDKGNMVCDYIFVNNKVKVNSFNVINTNISDHFPLVLDFEIL